LSRKKKKKVVHQGAEEPAEIPNTLDPSFSAQAPMGAAEGPPCWVRDGRIEE
jgi:hypothetical protein